MPKKIITGVVVSNKMQKSIVVQVERRKQHPLYKKYISIRKKYIAHDAEESARKGDRVKIIECRPISKRKTWELLEIIGRGKGGMEGA
ncbi:30S ribosomal protein S17 [bacterium]|nr:30S ribosomal protein S17 [bacterium]